MKKHLFTIGSAILLAACGGNTTENTTLKGTDSANDSTSANTKEVACTKAYNQAETWIKFGAFKTTEKKEVGGEFKEFTIEGTKQADTHEEIFANASFNIPIYGLDTKDLGRNKRIKEEFFGTMNGTENLTGKVTGFNQDSSKVNVELKMNELSQEIALDYTIAGDTIKLTGSLDVLNWEGSEALAALNKACESLHKGPDGVSKTWADVSLYITSVVKSTCE